MFQWHFYTIPNLWYIWYQNLLPTSRPLSKPQYAKIGKLRFRCQRTRLRHCVSRIINHKHFMTTIFSKLLFFQKLYFLRASITRRPTKWQSMRRDKTPDLTHLVYKVTFYILQHFPQDASYQQLEKFQRCAQILNIQTDKNLMLQSPWETRFCFLQDSVF